MREERGRERERERLIERGKRKRERGTYFLREGKKKEV